eukprot:jgi/Undpi1/12837/HiC_scaffold_7.g02504.m1
MVAQSRRRGSVLPVSADRRWDWLLGQVAHSFPKVAAQNIRAFGSSEGALQKVNAFLDGGEGDPLALYFFADKGNTGLRVDLNPPENAKSTCVYAVKLEARAISSETFDKEEGDDDGDGDGDGDNGDDGDDGDDDAGDDDDDDDDDDNGDGDGDGDNGDDCDDSDGDDDDDDDDDDDGDDDDYGDDDDGDDDDDDDDGEDHDGDDDGKDGV